MRELRAIDNARGSQRKSLFNNVFFLRLACVFVGSFVFFTRVSIGEEKKESYETIIHDKKTSKTADNDRTSFATRVELKSDESIEEKLRQIPGVLLRSQGFGQAQEVIVRGADSNRLAIFYDGIRLNSSAANVDLSLFDGTDLQAIEIRRSADGSRYGSSAIGGSIHLFSPKLSRRYKTRFNLGYGSFNSVQLSAAHGGYIKKLRYFFSLNRYQTQGDYFFEDDLQGSMRRENNQSETTNFLIKSDYHFGDWRISLLDRLSFSDRGLAGPAFSPRYDTNQKRFANLVGLTLRGIDWVKEGDQINLSLSQRYQSFVYDAEPIAERSDYALIGFETRISYQLKSKTWGYIEASFDSLVEWLDDRFVEKTIGDHRRIQGGGVLSGQLALIEKRLIFNSALRLGAANKMGWDFLPKLGVSFLLLRFSTFQLTFVSNLSRSVRYPSLQELYSRFEGIMGNPDLQAEDGLTIDGGFRIKTPFLEAEVALYQRWLFETIRFMRVDALTMAAENIGDSNAKGVEAAIKLKIYKCLANHTSYTYTKSEWGDRYRLPGQPTHYLSNRLGWFGEGCNGTDGHAFLSTFSLYVGIDTQSEMVLGRANSYPEEARFLLSIGGRLRYRAIRFALKGENLLDKKDAVDVLGYPLAGARFFMTAQVSF